MPSTVVHLALAGLLAAGLLGEWFSRRSLAVVLVVTVLPDLDAFVGLVVQGCVTVTEFGSSESDSVIFLTGYLKSDGFVCQDGPMKGVVVERDAKPVAYMEAGAYASFPRHPSLGLWKECHRSAGVQSTARTGLVRSRQTRDSQCCLTPLTVKRDESQLGGLSQNKGSNTAVQPARRGNRTHALTAWYPLWVNATEYY